MLAFDAVSFVFADLVWPALVLEQRILSILPILAGLLVEWLALWLGRFGLSWQRAALVDVVMNTASTLAGIVLIPLLGIAWELLPGSFLYPLFHVGTFNYGTWAATFVMAVLATTLVEFAIVKWGFKVPVNRRQFAILCLANAVSVGIAFASIWIKPPKL